jgi:hypothetical protein
MSTAGINMVRPDTRDLTNFFGENIMAYVDDSGGTFIGDIGFGGVTPSFPLHVEKSIAGSLIAKFRNPSVTGHGVQFHNGQDLHDSWKVTNSAGTKDTMQAFGDGILQIGEIPSVVSGITGGLRRDNGARICATPDVGDDATLFFAANISGSNGQFGGNARLGYVRAGADGGMRMECNVYTKSDGTTTIYDTGRGSSATGLDGNGSWAFGGTWPGITATAGQNLVIDAGGQLPYINKAAGSGYTDNFVMLCAQRAGQPLLFCTSPLRPSGLPKNLLGLMIESVDESQSPVFVKIDDVMNRLKRGASGTGPGGVGRAIYTD